MDRIYRVQRHFYDATRPFFLFGRDQLLNRIATLHKSRILEVGCGTGWNLRLLAKKMPSARLFGLDISSQMLQTAQAKLRRENLSSIQLVRASAEEWNYRQTFGQSQLFDVIFFSYSLSMIPNGQRALEVAIANLNPKGTLLVVDFWDQRDWPRWMRQLLVRWLRVFHVRHDPAAIDYFQSLSTSANWRFNIHSIGRRYAFLAELTGDITV